MLKKHISKVPVFVLVLSFLLISVFPVPASAVYSLQSGVPEFFYFREGTTDLEVTSTLDQYGIEYEGGIASGEEYELFSTHPVSLDRIIMKTINGLSLVDFYCLFLIDYSYYERFYDEDYPDYEMDRDLYEEFISENAFGELELYSLVLSFAEDLPYVVSVYEAMNGPYITEGKDYNWIDKNGYPLLSIRYNDTTKTTDVFY